MFDMSLPSETCLMRKRDIFFSIRVQCVPSRVHLDLLALIAPRSARVVTEGYVTTSAVSASAQLATLEKGTA